MNLAGAAGIITGGASGLGAATARRLAADGLRVVIVDVQEELGDVVARRQRLIIFCLGQ